MLFYFNLNMSFQYSTHCCCLTSYRFMLQSELKALEADTSSQCTGLAFCGTSRRGHSERTQSALQECGAIFRLFVLMLCHRPLHTQTAILSSALTLSLVSSTAEVTANMFRFLTQALTVDTQTVSAVLHRYILLPVCVCVRACVCVCVCVCTDCPCRGALTVRPSLDSQSCVRPWLSSHSLSVL